MNFFLLVLKIPLDLSPDASHKGNRFSKILLEKNLEFVSNRGAGIITLNLSFILLLIEVELILDKLGHKRDVLGTCGIDCVEIIFALLRKVSAFYVGATIIQFGVSGLKNLIPRY